MKRKLRLPHRSLGLLACASLLTISLLCSAATKKEPVYSEVPGVTTPRTSPPVSIEVQPANPVPAPAPGVLHPPPAAVPPEDPPPHPAAPTPEAQAKDKTLYSFQA